MHSAVGCTRSHQLGHGEQDGDGRGLGAAIDWRRALQADGGGVGDLPGEAPVGPLQPPCGADCGLDSGEIGPSSSEIDLDESQLRSQLVPGDRVVGIVTAFLIEAVLGVAPQQGDGGAEAPLGEVEAGVGARMAGLGQLDVGLRVDLDVSRRLEQDLPHCRPCLGPDDGSVDPPRGRGGLRPPPGVGRSVAEGIAGDVRRPHQAVGEGEDPGLVQPHECGIVVPGAE